MQHGPTQAALSHRYPKVMVAEWQPSLGWACPDLSQRHREQGHGLPENLVDDGIEVEFNADVAANIEAARAANEDQLQRVRTAILSMPADQRRHAWDAYRLLIRATTDADNALSLADEINEARLRQDRDWEESPPSTRPH